MNATDKTAITQKEKGFSLTELVVLIAMMTVVMAVAIPVTSNSMRSMQLLSDSRKVASTLTLAKLSATSKATHYQLLFDVEGNRWSLQKYNVGTGAFETEGAGVPLSGGPSGDECGTAFQASSDSAPTGFPTESSPFIRFNSRGIPINDAGTPTSNNVIFLSGNGIEYSVTVSLAGKVQLWKKRSGTWVAE